jgi:energy-coupling factor transporter ATP-binding protein EcfA2
MLLSIVGGSVGVTELHCACVAKDEKGLLLAGPSGSGKSTLALALSQTGFGFLSDDRAYCSLRNGKVLAWGLPTRLKLRREAGAWFRELRDRQPADVQKGEPVFWLEPEQALGLKRVRCCQPSVVIFLERLERPEFHFTRVSPVEAMYRLDRDLMAELPEAVARQTETIAKLVEIPCWLLKYGGEPRAIAAKIADHFERSCLTIRPAVEGEKSLAAMTQI